MASRWGLLYREERDGFWGDITSTLNFCEEDYAVSYHVAEFFNAFTNIIFFILGIRGLMMCSQGSHDTIYILGYLGYTIVGLGSTAFHATLKYPMQLVDELGMIYTTCLMAYATFGHMRGVAYRAVLGTSVSALAIFITAYYHATKNPKFHQDAYGVMTAVVVFHGMYKMEYLLRPALRARNPELEPKLMSDMWRMVWFGLSVFCGGYGIWNLDNKFCSTITGWRQQMLLPWAVVLEGHAWWHLMTGLGGYYYIVWLMWLNNCIEGKETEFNLVWPSAWTSVPHIKPVAKMANGSAKHINGSAKKNL